MSAAPHGVAGDHSPELVLVVNAGSSSMKYQLLDHAGGHTLASGLIERIGEQGTQASARHTGPEGTHEWPVECPDHRSAFDVVLGAFAEHGPRFGPGELLAIGHRVVHGGSRFSAPTRVDEQVISHIERLVPLAPLHNPGNLAGLRAAQHAFPGTPQVAVFDTAFHQSLPPHAYTYAVPLAWRDELGVRRYGFHGTSHEYVSRRAALAAGRRLEDTNTVVLHLGNGASASAVQGGRCIDTSMGLTPLEGLVMGTRPGDLDPALAFHMTRHGLTIQEYDRAINHESGLKGLTGTNDFREVLAKAAAGDADASLAFDVATYRLAKYVGAYAVALGSLDVLAFTAGIGEHSPVLRAAVVARLGLLGARLDARANEATAGERRISAADSVIDVWVIPTDEELEIARQTVAVIRG
ncbi:MAG: acetate/propionate family kinase [Dermatophilaceae bacterium]